MELISPFIVLFIISVLFGLNECRYTTDFHSAVFNQCLIFYSQRPLAVKNRREGAAGGPVGSAGRTVVLPRPTDGFSYQ